MRFNIFRNRNIDTQVGYLLDNFEQSIRNSAEDYWRDVIAKEVSEYLEEALADIDEFYGRGIEYDNLSHTLSTLIYLIRHKKYPPIGLR
jgi:hypothetical protein